MTIFRELSQHILDIAENGVTAGATLLHIDIYEETPADRLTITVQDNGKGMDESMLRLVTSPWVTTRATRPVGLGIPFLKQAAEMCAGRFEIRSQVGKGTTVVAEFRRSHIDRPPLGDLAGTILCIIVGYPQVDVVYHHRVDAREFTLDTREIRAILGEEVPFSDPEVLHFLRHTLETGIGELYSQQAIVEEVSPVKKEDKE